jgi:GNAT superfamily N-acetyltransferase
MILPAGYTLTVDQAQIDVAATHAFLTRSYWAAGITLETVARAVAGSFCVAVQFNGVQIGLARLVTDKATFAYLADLYVLEEHRGRGLAKAMLAALTDHPDLQGLRIWLLFTRDAHELYGRFGYTGLHHPERAMIRYYPEAYEVSA